MKYKKGDKVRIREDLPYGKVNLYGVNDFMESMAGQIVTIKRVSALFYYLIKEDNGEWWWEDEMFEDGGGEE